MKVLILGGTGFMGRALVTSLKLNCDVQLSVLNRGRTHWQLSDKAVDKSENLILDGINFIKCDRQDSEKFANVLQSNLPFDVIIDFCAYKASDVQVQKSFHVS